MNKKIIEFIKNNMHSHSEPFNLRIPKELKKFIELQAKKEDLHVADFTRAVLTNYIMPEFLSSQLKTEACDWITKQGKDCIEVDFGTKITKLRQVIKNANFAIDEIEKLQQKFLEAEVKCLNNISTKL